MRRWLNNKNVQIMSKTSRKQPSLHLYQIRLRFGFNCKMQWTRLWILRWPRKRLIVVSQELDSFWKERKECLGWRWWASVSTLVAEVLFHRIHTSQQTKLECPSSWRENLPSLKVFQIIITESWDSVLSMELHCIPEQTLLKTSKQVSSFRWGIWLLMNWKALPTSSK